MTEILNRLRQTAGDLINGRIEDGAVSTAMLVDAADEIERLYSGIQAVVDGTYGRDRHFKTKHDTCPHGQFSWQSCDPCVDEFLSSLIPSQDGAVTSQGRTDG